jgi:hypothetical protein
MLAPNVSVEHVQKSIKTDYSNPCTPELLVLDLLEHHLPSTAQVPRVPGSRLFHICYRPVLLPPFYVISYSSFALLSGPNHHLRGHLLGTGINNFDASSAPGRNLMHFDYGVPYEFVEN